MITKDRQYRHFTFETRAESGDGRLIVTGFPIVFNREAVLYEIDGIQYKEVIEPGALDATIMDDVVLNIDHKGKPAAKTRNGTLRLERRDDGLYMEADLSQNATGRELYEDIKNGFYDKMSFAFTVAPGGDFYDRATRTRHIKSIARLWDVATVTFPAYNETSISARSYFEAQAEAERQAAEAAEELRKRLIARTYL